MLKYFYFCVVVWFAACYCYREADFCWYFSNLFKANGSHRGHEQEEWKSIIRVKDRSLIFRNLNPVMSWATCSLILELVNVCVRTSEVEQKQNKTFSALTVETRNFHIGKLVLTGKLRRHLPNSLQKLHHPFVSIRDFWNCECLLYLSKTGGGLLLLH